MHVEQWHFEPFQDWIKFLNWVKPFSLLQWSGRLFKIIYKSRGTWSHSWIFLEVRVVQSFCYVIYFILNIYKRIISLRGYAWTHRASLIPPLFCWSTCTKTGKWAVMYLCARVSIWFFLRFWKKVNLELLRQCGIFRIAQTVWYF
jgi:hypothetical protein